MLTQTFIYNSWTKVECAQHISINVHLVTTSSFRFLAGVYADLTTIDGVGTLLTSVERKRIYNPTAQLVQNVPSHFHSCFNSQYGSSNFSHTLKLLDSVWSIVAIYASPIVTYSSNTIPDGGTSLQFLSGHQIWNIERSHNPSQIFKQSYHWHKKPGI